MQDEQTIHEGAPAITYTAPQLSRQQRRHAKQAAEYKQAVAQQGKRLVVGLQPSNPKYPKRHVGAKQLAKLLKAGATLPQQ